MRLPFVASGSGGEIGRHKGLSTYGAGGSCDRSDVASCRRKNREEKGSRNQDARVVKLVDTRDLKSLDHCGHAGSIPAPSTT
jgi:hypothetical protein